MILRLLLNNQIIWIIFINIKEYNTNKKHKILIVFNGMITEMLSNKKLNPTVTELFMIFIISLVFLTQSYLEALVGDSGSGKIISLFLLWKF